VIPADLRPNDTIRGPVGTELMGVSVALPLKEVTHDDGTAWDNDDWAAAVRYYQPQMLDRLREHVGGARFQTEPQLSVDGPHSDPLQGTLYVMTVAAWFNPLDLSVDCPAYRARTSRG
jgi:hypothetical protein